MATSRPARPGGALIGRDVEIGACNELLGRVRTAGGGPNPIDVLGPSWMTIWRRERATKQAATSQPRVDRHCVKSSWGSVNRKHQRPVVVSSADLSIAKRHVNCTGL